MFPVRFSLYFAIASATISLEKAISLWLLELMKRPVPSVRLLQRAVHLTVALGITSFLNTSSAADFTDANWMSMGGLPGANGGVTAAATDHSGNLYIGGGFTVIGDTIARHLAKWNGTNWTGLGAELGRHVGSTEL